MVDTAKSKIQIVISGQDGSENVFPFEQESVILGNSPAANIQLNDENASDLHIMLKQTDGKVQMVDLGSKSGTFINGEKVSQRDLTSDDKITIGNTVINVLLGDVSTAQFTEEITKPVADVVPEGNFEDSESTELKEVTETAKIPQESLSEPTVVVPTETPNEELEEKVEPIVVQSVKEGSEIQNMSLASWKGELTDLTTEHLFEDDLEDEEIPTEGSKVLEVAMFWGRTVMKVGHYLPGKTITLGESLKDDYTMVSEKLAADTYNFIQPDGEDYVIAFNEHMDVDVKSNGKNMKVSDLEADGRIQKSDGIQRIRMLKLGLTERVKIVMGDIIFAIRYVSPAVINTTNLWRKVDYYLSKTMMISFLGHMLILFAFYVTPLNLAKISEDLFKNPDRFAKLVLQPPEKKVKKDFKKPKKLEDTVKENKKFGKKEPELKTKVAPQVDTRKREEDKKKALSAGILGLLKKGGGSMKNIFAGGGLGTGINNALGGLETADMADADGLGGLGTRGGAFGGGASLGIGGIGTYGRGGKGKGGGYGNIDLGGRGKGMTRVRPGRVVMKGALDRSIIARIIRRHHSEIKFCYEKELSKNPNLYGKVVVFFIIGGNGKVVDAMVKQTTLNSENVENCILTKVKRWKFPKPKGGGKVEVSYPFILQSAGK